MEARVDLLHAAALFPFITSGHAQKAIHALKFLNRPEVGIILGRQFGEMMNASPHFIKPDLIIPIPLHYKRQQKRGYNQSLMFAQGISESIGVSPSSKYLIKSQSIISQTTKGREDRFENVLNSFQLKSFKNLKGENILIVDDVMTTGATLEAACVKVSQIPEVKIQLATIVIAND